MSNSQPFGVVGRCSETQQPSCLKFRLYNLALKELTMCGNSGRADGGDNK